MAEHLTDTQSLGDKLLHYVTDATPGYTRRPYRQGFRYLDEKGKPIRSAEIIARIRQLAIPPAWTEVWICPQATGHIQATGRDAKRRKQYIYHADYRSARETSKYQHLIAFAAVLPLIRASVRRDMARASLDQRKVSATVIFLLENTLIRIGNSEYARSNRSYGITTLRNPHIDIQGAAIKFKFRGKSGKMWNVNLTSRRAANILRACQELPGQLLFQYETAEGGLSPITSTEINSYLRDVTGADVTAKDYRTWGGTVLAAKLLHELSATGGNRKKMLAEVIRQVAAQLGNTPTICRQCYIHPQIQELFLTDTLKLRPRATKTDTPLDPYERSVLSLLKKRAKVKKVP
jgi:DNA topoisomerase-1